MCIRDSIIPASESNKNMSIHSLFDKKDIPADELDEYWRKISKLTESV
jgi:hypothetical protein